MKKKSVLVSLLIIMLIAGVFVLSGCGKKEQNSKDSKTVETQEKVTFTKEVEKRFVKYKVPEDMTSYGSFKDLGYNCSISYYTNQTSVYALYPYDDMVETINKVTINGIDYETYKYVDNLGIHYVYRTKVDNNYHLFTYDVYNNEYDDSQVETFMHTVQYL